MYTLELISPSLDNSLPENWTNFNEYGSPNEVNSPTANINSIEQTSSVLWPNPVENTLNITLNIKYLAYKYNKLNGSTIASKLM